MTNTLITWACGHFCIVASTTACMSDKDIIERATEDFWYLATNCDNHLANVDTTHHLVCQKNCGKCQEPVGASVWRNRAIQGINTLRYLHGGSKQMYLETGARYLALDFSQKARYAHHAKCAPAHEQFWISNTLRSDDPCLAPWTTSYAFVTKLRQFSRPARRTGRSSRHSSTSIPLALMSAE
jgi:hypothetical protein